MEVAGVVFRPAPCFASATATNSFSAAVKPPRSLVAGSVRFSDKGHLQYYDMNKEKKKEMKKQLKLLKGLSKNLSTFSDMGFGLNPDEGLDQQVKSQMISEASELLIAQLQKLKAEKLEYKRKKKEEKAKKKAARMMMDGKGSSSSSESECEKVEFRSHVKTSIPHQETAQILELESRDCSASRITNCGNVEEKKIEVCMGGKCKKSGAAVLLENFQAAVGGEAQVVGCKCMGKCRDGPNVRVASSSNQEGGMRNPLCIGVGLEDVDSIVASFFGGNRSALESAMSAA